MKPLLIPLVCLLSCLPGRAEKAFGPVVLEPFAEPPPPVASPAAQVVKEGPLTLSAADGYKELLEELGIKLDKGQVADLLRNKFLLVPITQATRIDPMEKDPGADAEEGEPKATGGLPVYADEMMEVYGRIGYDGVDVEPWRNKFVTADVMLHAWHKFFENAMEEIETYQLHGELDGFLDRLLANISKEKARASGPLRAHWETLAAQIGLAKVLLGDDEAEPRLTEVPGEYDDNGDPVKVKLSTWEARLAAVSKGLSAEDKERLISELDLVMSHEVMVPSPLFALYDPNQRQDYTQFTPRSHYTKNQLLRGYFRAMMYLGRQNWRLATESNEGLTDALLLAHAMSLPDEEGVSPLVSWKQIMEVTGFFAGASDDIGYPEFREWVLARLGQKGWKPELAIDAEVLTTLRNALGELRPPGILSQVREVLPPGETGENTRREAVQFRVFGQRFSYDAWIFTEMTPPVSKEMPATPTALFFPAALGDPASLAFARTWLASQERQAAMEANLARLGDVLRAVPDEQWFSSMAAKQLHVIGSLAKPVGEGRPAFMKGPAWAAKNVETMLGSYAQLKHNTVLYAKQSYAEMGEGGGVEKVKEESFPLGLVQPDLPYWAELSRLASYTFDGFKKHRLLPNSTEEWGQLARFKEDVTRLRVLAGKTASGEAWTRDDKLWLLQFTPAYMAEPLNPSRVPGPDDGKTALVADVQTNAMDGEVLYQGLGRPMIILALVGDQGRTRLVAGSAYDYYEFTHPIESRMTDEQWRKGFYRTDPQAVAKPRWLDTKGAAAE